MSIRGNLLLWIEAFLSGRSFYMRIKDARSAPKSVWTHAICPVHCKFSWSSEFCMLPVRWRREVVCACIWRSSASEWSRGCYSVLWRIEFGWQHDQSIGTLECVCRTTWDGETTFGRLLVEPLRWSICWKWASVVAVQTCSTLYKTYIRPILEFAGPVWCLILQLKRGQLESLQRRMTRLPYRWARPSYEERLMMGLSSFESRWVRGDLIVTFGALYYMFGCDLSGLFPLSRNVQLRGHNSKLHKEKCKPTSWQRFISNQVFNLSNGLPSSVMNSNTVSGFKNFVDALFDSGFQFWFEFRMILFFFSFFSIVASLLFFALLYKHLFFESHRVRPQLFLIW